MSDRDAPPEFNWRVNTWEQDPLVVAERSRRLRLAMPELQIVRRKAQADLTKAIIEIVGPQGYERRRAGLWVHADPFAVRYVELQKDSRGFVCHINIGVEKPTETVVPSHRSGTARRLGEFEDTTAESNRIDALDYYELAADPEFIPYLMRILRERAMPFLANRQTTGEVAVGPEPRERSRRPLRDWWVALIGRDG